MHHQRHPDVVRELAQQLLGLGEVVKATGADSEVIAARDVEGVLPSELGAAVVSGLVAYASARFLLRYLRLGRLDPFAYYCAALGVAGLVLIH